MFALLQETVTLRILLSLSVTASHQHPGKRALKTRACSTPLMIQEHLTLTAREHP